MMYKAKTTRDNVAVAGRGLTMNREPSVIRSVR
jgi:hypothetical protein